MERTPPKLLKPLPSPEWWEDLSNDAGLAAWELDLSNGRFVVTCGFEKMLGIPPGSFAGTAEALLALVHPDDVERCRDRLIGNAAPAQARSTQRFRLLRPDGRLLHLHACSICVMRDGQGRALRLRGTLSDIGDVVHDRDRIMAVAAMIGAVHGADCLPVIARSLATQLEAEACLIVRFRRGNCRSLAGWMLGTIPADLEWPIAGSPCETLQDGAMVVMPEGVPASYPRWQPSIGMQAQACIAVPLFSLDGQVIGGLLCLFAKPMHEDPLGIRDLLEIFSHRAEAELVRRDIVSDLERAEQRLHQNDKMDALGRLAGGIANDFNNMLAGIMGAAELLDARMGLESPHHRLVRAIVQSAERAADLTHKLLSFSRKTPVQRRLIDLRTPVEEALAVLAHSISHNISLRRDLGSATAVVAGDPGLLQSMVLNLCTNASEAMPRGGTLSVAITTMTIASIEPDWRLPAGRYVQLAVADTGVGMDDKTTARIFEPFFTTKAPGAGTGLGLAAAYGIIHEHGGSIRVRTAPGRGTTMLVRLPLLTAPVSEATAPHEADQLGAGLVLLVDDEELVRQATGELLGSLGWQVVHARDGEEGLRRFTENPNGFDLAVLDSIMPRMDGLACFRNLRELRPDLPVVFCSGYSRDSIRNEVTAEPHVSFVQKPFRIAELMQAIQTVRQG